MNQKVKTFSKETVSILVKERIREIRVRSLNFLEIGEKKYGKKSNSGTVHDPDIIRY